MRSGHFAQRIFLIKKNFFFTFFVFYNAFLCLYKFNALPLSFLNYNWLMSLERPWEAIILHSESFSFNSLVNRYGPVGSRKPNIYFIFRTDTSDWGSAPPSLLARGRTAFVKHSYPNTVPGIEAGTAACEAGILPLSAVDYEWDVNS